MHVFFNSIATESLFFRWIKPDFRPIKKHEMVSFKEIFNEYKNYYRIILVIKKSGSKII